MIASAVRFGVGGQDAFIDARALCPIGLFCGIPSNVNGRPGLAVVPTVLLGLV